MEFATHTSSPHQHGDHALASMMRQVLYALIPGTLAALYFFGWGVLINVVLAVMFCTGFEALSLKLRQRAISPALGDYSAVLTGWLIGVAIPQLAPWWLLLVACFFAIVVAKQLYGGLGYNPFNPAMVGYVVCLISFPAQMTSWLAPDALQQADVSLGAALTYVFSGQLPNAISWDAISMATPLDLVKTELRQNLTLTEIHQNPLFGTFSGQGWEWVANFYFLGGFYLLYKKVISWHIPVAVIIGLGAPAFLFYAINPDYYASPAFHVFSGAAVIGAFFIATDPVSGSTTVIGRLIFGAGIGLLTYIIRTWGGYPDAIAFAVLLMNMATPMIDHYTQPRVFGHSK